MMLERRTRWEQLKDNYLHLTEEEAQKLVDVINASYDVRPIPTELKDIEGHTIHITLDYDNVLLYAKVIIDRGDKK